MSLDNLHTQPYQRPKLQRGVDPQRMNWLWALICELGGVAPAEMLSALHADDVAVDRKRVRRWLGDTRGDDFSPLSIAELERNVRSLLALRKVRAAMSADGAADRPAALVSDNAGAILVSDAPAERPVEEPAVEKQIVERLAVERLAVESHAVEGLAAKEQAADEAPVAGEEALRELAAS